MLSWMEAAVRRRADRDAIDRRVQHCRSGLAGEPYQLRPAVVLR